MIARFARSKIGIVARISSQRTAKSGQSFVYSTEVNTWITPRVGIYASVSYYAQQHVGFQTWGGGTGVRVRF